MKRLFRIGIGLFFNTLVPVISWLILAIILDNPAISNIYSLTYPLQFILILFISIFGTGANIKKYREEKDSAVMNGLVLGIITSIIVFGLFLIFVEPYIKFMSLDIKTYKSFTIYSILQIFIQLIFFLLLEKLYFEGRDKQANIHSLLFNIINLATLIIPALITKNQLVIIIIPLISIFLYVLFMFIKEFEKFEFDSNISSNLKYESVNICSNIFLFAIYFFGFSNAFQSGTEYILAINFVALITDPSWDAGEAVSKSAKIDISQNTYNYKKSTVNGILFCIICSAISAILFFALFSVYEVNFKIALICLINQIFGIIAFGYLNNISTFYQLKYSASINTSIMLISRFIRTLFSIFLPTAFCTEIGQFIGTMILLIASITLRFAIFKMNKKGQLCFKHKPKTAK